MLFPVACSNIDCVLNNTVKSTYAFYDAATGSAMRLTDTLNVRAAGTDSLLWNTGYNLSSLTLPVSYNRSVDTLLFCLSDSLQRQVVDTVFVHHSNEPHFESTDCGTTFFHTVTHVAWTRRADVRGMWQIDSIAVADAKINYDEKTHFKVYFARH